MPTKIEMRCARSKRFSSSRTLCTTTVFSLGATLGFEMGILGEKPQIWRELFGSPQDFDLNRLNLQ
jgi:hypothetical protein